MVGVFILYIFYYPPSPTLSFSFVVANENERFESFYDERTNEKAADLWVSGFFVGAGDRTRTCTVAHWFLRPACLPFHHARV